MGNVRIIDLERSIFESNDEDANRLREELKKSLLLKTKIVS